MLRTTHGRWQGVLGDAAALLEFENNVILQHLFARTSASLALELML